MFESQANDKDDNEADDDVDFWPLDTIGIPWLAVALYCVLYNPRSSALGYLRETINLLADF